MAELDVRPDSAPQRWNPFSDLDRLRRDLFSGWPSIGFDEASDAFVPPADVEELDDAWKVEIELPGIAKSDIAVEMAGRTLVVTGERKDKERDGVLRHRKRVTGTFRYEVTLPGDVDGDAVSAQLADGELTVRLPKTEANQPRKIDIS